VKDVARQTSQALALPKRPRGMALFSCDVVEDSSSGPKTRRQNGNARLMSWLFRQEERRACDQQQRQLSWLVLMAARGVKIYINEGTMVQYSSALHEVARIEATDTPGRWDVKCFSLETAEATRVTAVCVCDVTD
jgi:hypothetical protein